MAVGKPFTRGADPRRNTHGATAKPKTVRDVIEKAVSLDDLSEIASEQVRLAKLGDSQAAIAVAALAGIVAAPSPKEQQ